MAALYILIIFGAPLAALKYLGMRALRPVVLEISGPPLAQIVEVGTKSSHSIGRRLFGSPQAQQAAGGGATWDIRSGAGIMTVLVEPLLDGSGHRITAQATGVRIAQHGGIANPHTDYGRAKILTNWLFRALGIPHNPRKLLRQRRRVLRAIRRTAK